MLLACVLATPLAARDVDGLYGARVVVADRSPGELARGTRAALATVLTKLTGMRAAARDKATAGVLDRASQLLLRYAYETSADGAGFVLVADFDETALAAELAARAVPIWGKERPDTVMWLVIDDPAGRQLVGGEGDTGTARDLVRAAAERRGIPLLLPLLDINETQRLAGAAGAQAIAAAALELAPRYATPATLIGYLHQDPAAGWQSDWTLRIDGEDAAWQAQGTDIAPLLDAGVDGLADALARRYADPTMLAQADSLRLRIVGVRSAADYARVVTYLGHLDTVARLFVARVANDRLDVEVRARGGHTALAQSIAFGRVLAPRAGDPATFELLP